MGMSRFERGDRLCRLKVPIRCSSASWSASCRSCFDSKSREVGVPKDRAPGRSVLIPRIDRDNELGDFVDFAGLVSGGWGLVKTVGTFMMYIDSLHREALLVMFLFL